MRFAMRARCWTAARAHRSPIAALQDRRTTGDGGARPLVDVARHVIDAEHALALRLRSRRDALPELIELGGDGLFAFAVGVRIVGLPRFVRDAGVLVAIEAVRVRHRFFALTRERPLVFR